MFTCPGIANPRENRTKRTFPVTFIILAIAKDAMLARTKVMSTDKEVTKILFLKFVRISPSSSNRL
jgi:hypothetical protein